MDEAQWVRAAAVVAGLAGASADETFAAFDPAERAAATAHLAALRASGGRAQVARAIVRARLALAEDPPKPADGGAGARFLARWLRALDAGERVLVLRRLDRDTAAAVAAAARAAAPLDEGERATAWWLVARARELAGRLPTAAAWTEVLAALAGRYSSDALATAVERSARITGRRARCASLARAVLG